MKSLKTIKKLINNEEELLSRAREIEGLSFSQLANRLNLKVPDTATKRKGWVGQAIELALGTTAGTSANPDFLELGIELKTIPLNQNLKPSESTFITSISLLTLHLEQWEDSQCFKKLKRVLWVPIEGDKNIPFIHRRIGQSVLWSPNEEQYRILKQDWDELSWLVASGQLPAIHAGIGYYLHIRPKARNRSSLCFGLDEDGNKIKTLPRGFYLRSQLTKEILSSAIPQ